MEEVGSDDGVVSNEGVELMVGRVWGVDGRVRVPGHCLMVEDAEGVATEGSVGVAMFDGGGGLLLSLPSFGFLCWGWLISRVEVPHWRGEVPEGGCGVEKVVTLSLVSSGGCQDGGCFSSRVVAPFIRSTGFRRWYSFRSTGACRCPAGSHVLLLSGYPSHLTKYCNCFPLP